MTGWSASDSLRMLARRYHDERCQKRLAACVGVDLRGLEPVLGRGPGRDERGGRPVGLDVAAVERLGAGQSAFEPKPSASRWYGVSRSVGAVAREDGQDRDGLAELAQAGDEAAARERDVVRMRRDEDMGHGRPSIPSALAARPLRSTPGAFGGRAGSPVGDQPGCAGVAPLDRDGDDGERPPRRGSGTAMIAAAIGVRAGTASVE